jgi:predicted phage terminase large subunit-like protein
MAEAARSLAMVAARERLAPYALVQGPTYQVAPHHRAIAQKLEAVERGDIKRLMIFMPPRHGKTKLASHYFPAWYLGRNPARYVIATTYAQEFADDNGRAVLDQLRDPLHRATFPACSLRRDSKAVGRFQTDQGGVYFGVGAGGPITGRGAHLLLIDDPVKGQEQAESETQRRKLKDWYASVAYTRLMPGGAVVIIQTRWHEDDLAGWLLREHAQEGWDVLSLPALDDFDRPLWPEAFGLPELQAIKRAVGTRVWTALYQQRPTPPGGSIIKLEWFRRYSARPANFAAIVQSWDTATKAKKLNDPWVCTTWGITVDDTAVRFYLLEVFRKRMEYPEGKRTARNLRARWNPSAILVEDASSGQSLGPELQLEGMPIVLITPQGEKMFRLAVESAKVEAGMVYLPEVADWLIDYEAELVACPNAPHDDQADSTSQFLRWAGERLAGVGDAVGVEYHDPVTVSPI